MIVVLLFTNAKRSKTSTTSVDLEFVRRKISRRGSVNSYHGDASPGVKRNRQENDDALSVFKIRCEINSSDLMTKHIDQTTRLRLMTLLSFVTDWRDETRTCKRKKEKEKGGDEEDFDDDD